MSSFQWNDQPSSRPRSIRAPFQNIDCQSLVALPRASSGWLRIIDKSKKWTQKFTVIYSGYVYMFKSESCASQKDCFSLYGYTSVERATEMETRDRYWVIKIIPASDITYTPKYFALSSEADLNIWTYRLFEEMQMANGHEYAQRVYEDMNYSSRHNATSLSSVHRGGSELSRKSEVGIYNEKGSKKFSAPAFLTNRALPPPPSPLAITPEQNQATQSVRCKEGKRDFTLPEPSPLKRHQRDPNQQENSEGQTIRQITFADEGDSAEDEPEYDNIITVPEGQTGRQITSADEGDSAEVEQEYDNIITIPEDNLEYEEPSSDLVPQPAFEYDRIDFEECDGIPNEENENERTGETKTYQAKSYDDKMISASAFLTSPASLPSLYAQPEKASVKPTRFFSSSELHGGSWFHKLVICCDGKMVNIDSCDGKTEFTNNVQRFSDNMSKDQKELSRYLHSLFCHKKKEFEVLLIFSTLLKESIIKPEDWLLTVIEHQHRMACYMLLAYMTVTETRKEDVILPALKLAIEKGANNIAKSISWYIIRELLRTFSFDIDSLLDIWPAIVCKNTNCSELTFCSTDLVIVVETKQSTGDLPITFWNIKIKYLSQASGFKTKKKMKEHMCSNAPRVECFLEKFEIDGNLASKLFKMHSKLTCICKSVYKSKDCKKIERACVQLFCRGKGFIPVNENHFPKSINNVETDVLEGEPVLAARLRVGEKINSNYLSGTLGGFVKVLGDITFLTCAHVVLHEDNFSGKRLTFPSNEAVYMDCVQPSPTPTYSPNSQTTFRCGKLRYIEFKTDRPGETSIDAALIKLQKNIEVDTEDFIANIRNEKQNVQSLGMRSPFLNDNCIDCDKMFHGISFRQFENVTVGAESCFHVNRSTMHMAEDKEEGIHVDREPITETYKRIVESENPASSHSSHFSSRAPVFSNNVHLHETHLMKVDKERTLRRLSRCMYNQIAVTHIPFQPGDSGTCIYVRDNSLNVFGCIGMAIANHPDLDGGVIVTPMKEILKTFHVDIH